jgi:hypothetical protein
MKLTIFTMMNLLVGMAVDKCLWLWGQGREKGFLQGIMSKLDAGQCTDNLSCSPHICDVGVKA